MPTMKPEGERDRASLFNIVAGRTGSGQAMPIRAAEPLGRWNTDLSGPGKLTLFLCSSPLEI
jgi:3-methyladenine DNA glycosylase Mpg